MEESPVKTILTRLRAFLHNNLRIDTDFISSLSAASLLTYSDADSLQSFVSLGGHKAQDDLLQHMEWFYDEEMLEKFCRFLEEHSKPAKPRLSKIAERIRQEMKKHQPGPIHQPDPQQRDGVPGPTAIGDSEETQLSVKTVLTGLRTYLLNNLRINESFVSNLSAAHLLNDSDAHIFQSSIRQGDNKVLYGLLHYMEWFYDEEMLEKFCRFLEEHSKPAKPRLGKIAERIRQDMKTYQPGPIHQPDPQQQDGEPGPTAIGLPSSSSPVTRGESTRTMSTMDERSEKIKEIVDKYRNGEGELILPRNPDLEDELDNVLRTLRRKLSSADSGVISNLHGMFRRKYRRYIHGVRPVPLPRIPNTVNGLFDFIEEKSTPYEILLVHHAVEVLEDEDLKKDLQEYELKLAEHLEEMLMSCKRRKVTLPLRKDHTHMAIVISEEQVLSLVLEMKKYFSKYLHLEETLFEGFEEGCTVLFFSILRVDAALLSPKVLSHLSELKRMFGMTHLIVFGYFACDLEKATIELVSDSEDVVSLKTELAAVRSSLQTELEKVTREKAEMEMEKVEMKNNLIARGMKLKVKEEELDQSKKEAEMYKNNTVKLAKQKFELEEELRKMKKEKSELEVGMEKETEGLKTEFKKLEEENRNLKKKNLLLKHLPGAEGLEMGECISKGDYQSVYKGRYNSRPVAVKKISDILVNRESADLEKAVEDLRRECDILRAAKDPHIIEFIGVFNDKTQEDGVMLVMEFMDQTLETFLKDNRGNLSKEKQVDICQQIASGLRYLHHQDPQILHRDLKPSNILLDEDGRIAKIGDFGQAKFCPSDIQYLTTTQPGTVLYMPPEALHDKETRFTDKGDVFSLGVVMLEVATQEPPSCSIVGIDIVPEVDRRAKDLSKVPDDHSLKALIRACLKDDPKERPTIEEIHLELSHPGAWKLYTEVKKNEPKVFQSDVLLKGNKLQSIQLPPLPIPTCHATAIVIGGKIYVSGGTCSSRYQDCLVKVYDTITTEWTTLPPSSIFDSESTLVNGQLTLIGGRDASTVIITNSTITWDEEKKQWFPKVPPMPTKRLCPCIIHCNNLMLVAGGIASNNMTLLDSVDVFNMDTFQWTTSSSFKLPLPMWDMRASISSGYLYIACGRTAVWLGTKSHHNAAYKLPVEEVVNAITKEQEVEWIRVQNTPYSLSGLVEDSDHPIVVGGNDKSGKPTSDVSIYDPTTDKWSNVGQCVRPHFVSCAIAVSSSSFVVIGGCTDDANTRASVTGNFELFYV